MEAERVKKKAERYFCEKGELFRRSLTGNVLRCIGKEDQEKVMREVHGGLCGRHQGGKALWSELLKIGYYWPNMKEDAIDFARKCEQCQKHNNRIHAPALAMKGLSSPYPFYTWAMDFVGPINPPSGGRKWILAATEHFTKLVEAAAYKKADSDTTVQFIKEHIICRFGLPKRIMSDNGTHFINKKVEQILEDYGITHHKSTPYYPQSNGQAESTNKILLKILARMVDDAPTEWGDCLPLALWAYRVTKHGTTKATPFSLVYGAEATLPVEITVPSARMIISNEEEAGERPERLEGARDKAHEELLKHQRRVMLTYEKIVVPRMFAEGELVLKATDAVMRNIHTSKWAPKWEGPYIIEEAHPNGYCFLLEPNEQRRIGPLNFKYIKKYYA